MVLGLCRLLLRDPDEAEDAAQQVFLSAHRALLSGTAPRDAPAWLAAIARNECRSRIRIRMREPLGLPELPSDLPDPLASAIHAVDLDAVWTALSSLPRQQRRALVLRELGGLTYDELGRSLGVSQSAVESLLFRARQQIRSVLAGANAAAVPLALRDELARLIPGFDPGSASLVARIAALPVAVKLATAAAGVGVVATGAAEFPQHRARPVEAQPPLTQPAVARPESSENLRPVLVAERTPRPRDAEPPEDAGRETEHADGEREQAKVEEERDQAEERKLAQAESEHAAEPEWSHDGSDDPEHPKDDSEPDDSGD